MTTEGQHQLTQKTAPPAAGTLPNKWQMHRHDENAKLPKSMRDQHKWITFAVSDADKGKEQPAQSIGNDGKPVGLDATNPANHMPYDASHTGFVPCDDFLVIDFGKPINDDFQARQNEWLRRFQEVTYTAESYSSVIGNLHRHHAVVKAKGVTELLSCTNLAIEIIAAGKKSVLMTGAVVNECEVTEQQELVDELRAEMIAKLNNKQTRPPRSVADKLAAVLRKGKVVAKPREEREERLLEGFSRRSTICWLVGSPNAGKTTLAFDLVRRVPIENPDKNYLNIYLSTDSTGGELEDKALDMKIDGDTLLRLSLLDFDSDTVGLDKIIALLKKEIGDREVGLVVVDLATEFFEQTWTATEGGGNYDPRDPIKASHAYRNIARPLLNKIGGMLLLVDHPPKNAAGRDTVGGHPRVLGLSSGCAHIVYAKTPTTAGNLPKEVLPLFKDQPPDIRIVQCIKDRPNIAESFTYRDNDGVGKYNHNLDISGLTANITGQNAYLDRDAFWEQAIERLKSRPNTMQGAYDLNRLVPNTGVSTDLMTGYMQLTATPLPRGVKVKKNIASWDETSTSIKPGLYRDESKRKIRVGWLDQQPEVQ